MLSLLKSFPTLYGSQKDMNASELESFKREAFQVLSTMSFDSFQVLLPFPFQLATQRMLYHLVFTQLNLQRNVPSICLLLTCFPLEYQRIQRNVCQKRRRTGLRNALLSLSLTQDIYRDEVSLAIIGVDLLQMIDSYVNESSHCYSLFKSVNKMVPRFPFSSLLRSSSTSSRCC